jgi:hypothetical protein
MEKLIKLEEIDGLKGFEKGRNISTMDRFES